MTRPADGSRHTHSIISMDPPVGPIGVHKGHQPRVKVGVGPWLGGNSEQGRYLHIHLKKEGETQENDTAEGKS